MSAADTNRGRSRVYVLKCFEWLHYNVHVSFIYHNCFIPLPSGLSDRRGPQLRKKSSRLSRVRVLDTTAATVRPEVRDVKGGRCTSTLARDRASSACSCFPTLHDAKARLTSADIFEASGLDERRNVKMLHGHVLPLPRPQYRDSPYKREWGEEE